MHYFNPNLTAPGVLLLWFLVIVIVLILEATVVFADPGNGCMECSCSGNGCCPGCQEAEGWNGYKPVVEYIQAGSCPATIYNYCVIDGSQNSCTSENVYCYYIREGEWDDSYTVPWCSEDYGPLLGPGGVVVTGCEP